MNGGTAPDGPPAVEGVEAVEAQGIAVIGLAARFPGAPDAVRFWENLREGSESISRFTVEELAAAGVAPGDLADPRYVRAKGVLAGADRFDAAFFGFTPREAEVMDPQHRVFLECAWESLEDAGCVPRRFAGRIGVWAGCGAGGYLIDNLLPARERLETVGALQVMLLNDRDFLASRTSWALDLKGPSVTVQTACSTALVAVHTACQSLLGGECDVALAGGVSISVPLACGYLFQEGGVMSPDGRCRAFDAAAAGSVEANGCGVVTLKRLADARADGDRIHAVIRGSAVNNDGAARVGFTAPSVDGQADVILESLLMAGVDPATVGYVEAHGSGTPLGDPIEIAALTQAFGAAGEALGAPPAVAGWCGVGSVKTNIGHCNAAAGAAGLIKAILALEHRTIPPSLHFTQANPRLELAGSPFYVPAAAAAWPASTSPRRAGVSSFGLGGSNAHVVLEEAPARPRGDAPARAAQLLVLAARTPAALQAAAERLHGHLSAVAATATAGEAGEAGEAGAVPALADLAWTLQTGRRAFPCRRIVVARDAVGAAAGAADGAEAAAPGGPRGVLVAAAAALAGRPGSRSGLIAAAAAAAAAADAAGGLGRAGAGVFTGLAVDGHAEGQGRPVVFLLPGVGEHYAGMAAGLYKAEAVFRREVDRCAARLAPLLGADLREVMFAPRASQPEAPESGRGSGPDLRALRRGAAPDADQAASEGDALGRTLFAQPACFVVEYALARLLMSWGIEPQALLGYSVGEIAAACLSGSLTLDEALDLVAERARLAEELPAGSMLAVPLAAGDVLPLLGEGLALAATNGPHLSVVAGATDAVGDLARRLEAAGTACVRLRTRHAFHSPMMAPAARGLSASGASGANGARLPMRAPLIPWVSNVTGSWITADDLADPTYWARHLTGTVRFGEGLSELLREPRRVFLEVGPGSTLATLVRQHPSALAEQIAVTTLRRLDEVRGAVGDAGAVGDVGDVELLLEAAGRLWLAGVEVDWLGLHGGERRLKVELPTYPFERQRFWIDPPAPAAGRDLTRTGTAGQELPGAGAAGGETSGGLPFAADDDAASGAVDDWFWVPSWKRTAALRSRWHGVAAGGAPAGAGGAMRAGGRGWLILADAGGLGGRIAARLRGAGETLTVVSMGDGFAVRDDGSCTVDPVRRQDYEALFEHCRTVAGALPERMVHLWGVGPKRSFGAAQSAGLISLTMLAQAVAAQPQKHGAGAAGLPEGAAAIQLLVAADGLAEVLDGDAVQPAKATLLGALKVIHQEVPRLAARAVDVTPLAAAGGNEAWEERLAGQLLAEAELSGVPPSAAPAAGAIHAGSEAALVALRGSQRFVRIFERHRLPEPAPPVAARGAVYLVAAAEQGPGAAMAEHLVRRHEARLGLVVPADFPADGGGSTAASRLLTLARDAGPERVLLLRSSAAGPAAFRAAMRETRRRFGALHGAFWTGGGGGGGLLQLKTAAGLLGALEPVALGAEALLAACGLPDLGADAEMAIAAGDDPVEAPAFVVLSSTTMGVTGGLGQLDMAAAGSYLEALAARAIPVAGRAAGASAAAVSDAAGGPAAAGTAVVGATPATPAMPALPVVMAVHWDPYQWNGWLVAGVGGGMAGLSAEDLAASLASHAVAEERSGAALDRLLANPTPVAIVAARDLEELMAETDSVTAESWQLPAFAPPGTRSPRPELPVAYEAPRDELEEEIAAIWQELFGIAAIGRDDSFLDLGGHSLLAIQIVTQVRHRLDADLPVTALFEAPTVASLAAAVRQARGDAGADEIEALLDLVEGLSASEAAERLAELAGTPAMAGAPDGSAA